MTHPARFVDVSAWLGYRALVLLALCVLALPGTSAAQGVTTGAVTGIVTTAQGQPVQGASVIAIHLPSGSTYESTTRADGRFSIVGMRVGGPYSVTVTYTGSGGGAAFAPETQENVTVNLGVASDIALTVRPISVQEQVTVTAPTSDAVFSSSRTGAATAVKRVDIATLPTVRGNIIDLTRLTPQASGSSYAGGDNRENNMTIDGSYFNNSFGLGDGQPGGRTNVAPISLESIEQVQVSIAPFDVRQGNFVGAAVNTVTRSGTNQLTGSFYYRYRNQDFIGSKAGDFSVTTPSLTFHNAGFWAGGPIVKNKLFVFGNYENEKNTTPLHTFVANTGGQPVGGSVTRVLASDLNTLSSYLKQNFGYDTGPYQDYTSDIPVKRYLIRGDYNVNNGNKVSFRYNQLASSSFKLLSGSSSAGFGRTISTSGFIPFQSTNYSQLENIKSGVGEWNSVLGGSMSQNVIVGYTTNNENRLDPGKLFPFTDILGPDGTTYATFGTEPFTPNNELLYHTYQATDSITKFGNKHSLTFGGTWQKYESDNSFFNCCKQGAYVYSSLADFYADANGFLANPSRTSSPIIPRRYQVRWMNIPGLDKPLQVLKVTSGGGWFQDEWRPVKNVTITGGIRFDTSRFGNTGYPNPNADALTFRDEKGAAVQYSSGHLPDAKILWSPRVGFNWDVAGDQQTQVRGGTGIFSGPPLFVWISNQLGNTGVLQGSLVEDFPTSRPFTTDIDKYKPQNVTGAPAASYELDVTDNHFKFPQAWRNDIAVDRRLPGGMTATAEFIYNKDVNGIYYINANLPAAQSAFVGVDARPRWVGSSCTTPGPCINRINNAAGNQVTSAIVMKNESEGYSWVASGLLSTPIFHGLSVKGAYSYGDAKNTIDPGSTASSSFTLNQISSDPNNPGLGRSAMAQGHRVFVQSTYSRSYFGFGATTISAFWEAKPAINSAGGGVGSNASYVFSGDMNGDGGSNSDLIYIPKDMSEMNFQAFTQGATTFTAEQQAQAFETYIKQDPYLSKHRGQYAERGGLWYPMVKRMDLSIVQDVFHNIGGKRNGGQFRIDITNFGNLLNHNWGVSQRLNVPVTQSFGAQLLTTPSVDAQGRATYRMAVVGGQLVTKSFTSNANTNLTSTAALGSDVYQFMLSFRYSFN